MDAVAPPPKETACEPEEQACAYVLEDQIGFRLRKAHQRASEIANSGEFDNIGVKPPEAVETFLVLHVVDPSGVLLVFVQ